MQKHGFSVFADMYNWSITQRAEFWDAAVKAIDIRFAQPYTNVLDLSNGVTAPNWLLNAKLNIVESCFKAPPQQVAIVYKAANGISHKVTYEELHILTNRVSNSLQKLGLKPGAAIAIDMLMSFEAVAIYLGIIQAGFVAVGIADSFAATEVSKRVELSKAELIFTQDNIQRDTKVLPLYQKLYTTDLPPMIVLASVDRAEPEILRAIDRTWQDFLQLNDKFTPVVCNPHDPINILFSSGTTGDPKAIVWDHTSAIKAAVDGFLYQNVQPNDIFAWPTSLGWMMGPWLIFATLINKATMALYYDVPTTRKFAEFVANNKVTILGLVPSIVKALRIHDHTAGLDWSAIKLFSSTGETSNESDMKYLMQTAGGKPIIEYCGGTEISGAYITSTLLQENIPAAFSTPALGMDLKLIDAAGNYVQQGEVALIPPVMGLSRVLLNRDNYQEYYAPMPKPVDGTVLRRHGDQLLRLANGYYKSLGRADDAMNLGGIKISAAEIEHCFLEITDIVEAVAIGKNNINSPVELIIYAVPVDPKVNIEQLKQQMQAAINTKLNPLFKISAVKLIEAIPRTTSNKIMRRVLRDQL